MDKATTGTYNFVSVILNVAFVGALIRMIRIMEQDPLQDFADHVKVKDTSQLIKGIYSVLRKLLKCFNGTTISAFFFCIGTF